MRLLGMGAQVDELELGMNRAAEQAAPAAKQIFLNSLTKMTFTDARQILSGSDTAATDFFKRTSTEQLTTAFQPIVHQSMENVGVVRQYDELMQSPVAQRVNAGGSFNLDNYVVGKALDGLFYMMGEEEKKIRKTPPPKLRRCCARSSAKSKRERLLLRHKPSDIFIQELCIGWVAGCSGRVSPYRGNRHQRDMLHKARFIAGIAHGKIQIGF